jgi:hypothetical protein
MGRGALMEKRINVNYFDGAELLLIEDPDTPIAMAELQAFLNLSAADRLAASRHVYAYYRDFREETGGESWLDAQMGVPSGPEAIWAHVRPLSIVTRYDSANPSCSAYVVVECNCDWEEEHGLMLSFLGGHTLVKCGEYSHHITNRGADSQGMVVVYAATNPNFTTRLDP